MLNGTVEGLLVVEVSKPESEELTMEELPEPTVVRPARIDRRLQMQRTLPAQFEATVAIVKRTGPGCAAAGIILLVDGEPKTGLVGALDPRANASRRRSGTHVELDRRPTPQPPGASPPRRRRRRG